LQDKVNQLRDLETQLKNMNAGGDSIKSECDTLQSKLREAEKDKSKLENDM